MRPIHEIVAQNLANYRGNQGLSLDKVSKLTGVSKTMLSQIEKADSNPTITILWKIASGLRIPLSALTSENEEKVNCIDRADLQAIDTENDRVKIYPYFPFDEKKGFEMFMMEFDGQSEIFSEGHHQQSEEYILVNEGELKLLIDGEWHVVKKHQAIRFKSDRPHTYKNTIEEKISLTVIVYYQRNME